MWQHMFSMPVMRIVRRRELASSHTHTHTHTHIISIYHNCRPIFGSNSQLRENVFPRRVSRCKPRMMSLVTMAMKCDSVNHNRVIKFIVIIILKIYLNQVCPNWNLAHRTGWCRLQASVRRMRDSILCRVTGSPACGFLNSSRRIALWYLNYHKSCYFVLNSSVMNGCIIRWYITETSQNIPQTNPQTQPVYHFYTENRNAKWKRYMTYRDSFVRIRICYGAALLPNTLHESIQNTLTMVDYITPTNTLYVV